MAKLAQARSSEYGTKWGEPGNQLRTSAGDDGELDIRDVYSGFTICFRWKDSVKAKHAAVLAEGIVKNPLVGYAQNNGSYPRTGLYDELKKCGGVPEKIKTKCNTDCSAMCMAILRTMGINVPTTMYTGTQCECLRKTGEFDEIPITTGMKFKAGDILWMAGHTATVITDDDETTSSKIGNCKSVWLRKDGGVGSIPLVALQAGTEIEVLEEKVVWQKIKVKSTGKTGYVKEIYIV